MINDVKTINDALIFDIDGTLWNASSSSAKGWNNGFMSLGLKERVTEEDIESIAGNPYEDCVEILFPGLLKKYPFLIDTLDEYESDIIEKEGGAFYQGVLSGIKELSRHYSVFLISNCQEWYIKLFLGLSGLEPYLKGFDCNGMAHAPKDIMIKNMINKFSLKNPVYIGDTGGDEKATMTAGVEFIHAAYGFGEIKYNHHSFSSFGEIVSFFKEKYQILLKQ